MRVNYTVSRRSLEGDTATSRSTLALPTRVEYGFTDDIEVLTAHGVVGSLRERHFNGSDIFISPYLRRGETERDYITRAQLDRLEHELGNAFPPVAHIPRMLEFHTSRHVPCLSDESSANFFTALNWAARPEERMAAINERSSFLAVSAAAVLLHSRLVDLSGTAYNATMAFLNTGEHPSPRTDTGTEIYPGYRAVHEDGTGWASLTAVRKY